jgi:hypothetical protein
MASRGGVRVAARDANAAPWVDVVAPNGEGELGRVDTGTGIGPGAGLDRGTFHELDPYNTTLADGVVVGRTS